MRYPFTFYVDSLPPDVGGCANMFVIRILKKYRGVDEGIYQHELEHVTQWGIFAAVGAVVALFAHATYGDLMLTVAIALFGASAHGLLYRFVEAYRLFCETEAYRIQALYYMDDRRALFGGFLAKYYNLNITPEEAEQLLRG